MPVPLDGDELRDVYGRFPTGVVGVCAEVDGAPVGLAVSTFVPVSLDPPLVSICVRAGSATWPLLRLVPRLGISVLGAHHEGVARALAGPAEQRFRDVVTEVREGGAVVVGDAPLALTVTVVDDVVAGDHLIVVCRVNEVLVDDGHSPLVVHRSALRPLAAV
ncbi:flavin reductase family protein [Actinomycetospora lemnae]|uniref:Flavin reductase family protein n=1 Tax=Actinomycetospora lemnae TaxID=3019891 RepID=A0ABT5SRB2_9PSEU|nr:flavin reductase family protein [Actinomycetospora sp. DW7H6]MDD7965398.1 flavin reductase family protein [Actinomycetospora sp. DW7H6]